jgi:tetratricopeptide (TPR) repeat protein
MKRAGRFAVVAALAAAGCSSTPKGWDEAGVQQWSRSKSGFYLGLAEQEEARGRRSEALGYLRQAVAENPAETGAWLRIARLYAEEGRASEAAGALDRLPPEARQGAEYAFARGLVLELSGQAEAAAQAFGEAARLAPGRPEFRKHEAEAALAANRPAPAGDDLLAAELERRRGSLDAATALYRKALAAAPGDDVAFGGLLEVLFFSKKFTEASDLLRGSPAQAAALGGVRLRLAADAHLIAKRFADAADAYARAVAEAPRSEEARYRRGLALEGLGRGAEALADYRAALELRPGHPGALLRAGLVHFRAGRREEAWSMLAGLSGRITEPEALRVFEELRRDFESGPTARRKPERK